jgi:hypothetical protein
LRVEHEAGFVELNVETLGEYPTTIRRVRLSDQATGTVLWEIMATEGTPQVHRIRLRLGPNGPKFIDADGGEYSVVVPSADTPFLLLPATTYVVEVWGERKDRDPSVATFQIDG